MRERQGVSQNELARLLGVSQGYVSKCQTGDLRLDIVQIHAFCDALNVPFLELMEQYESALNQLHKQSRK